MRFYVILLLFCTVALIALPDKQSAHGRKHSSNCSYSSPNGVPGIPGIPGVHGRDGRDGRNGDQGPRGPTGVAGPRGPRGKTGKPGTNGLSSYSNWKECPWKNINEGKDNGLVRSCVFKKKYTDSFLHVYWNGALRVYNCNYCCKRWFFTFNGAECQVPYAIDGVVYMRKGVGIQDPHRVRQIEGHCGKIHKGHVRVGFNVGNCAGYGNADANTGWNSISRIFVEEVPGPQS